RFLAKLGPTAIPPLIKGLKDDDEKVRYGCMVVLSEFGPTAKAAVPQLVEVLNRPDPPQKPRPADNPVDEAKRAADEIFVNNQLLQFQAAATLWAIEKQPKTIVPKLIDILLNDKTEIWRSNAARMLGSLGPEAR